MRRNYPDPQPPRKPSPKDWPKGVNKKMTSQDNLSSSDDFKYAPRARIVLDEPSQEELDNILKDFGLEVSGGDFTKEQFLKAKSAINSLTLKQVLEVIGKNEPETDKFGDYLAGPVKRNAFRAELRQSAERIWS